jgi:hypothetical protein
MDTLFFYLIRSYNGTKKRPRYGGALENFMSNSFLLSTKDFLLKED